MANLFALNSVRTLSYFFITLVVATGCVGQKAHSPQLNIETRPQKARQHSMLSLPGHGMEIPILTSKDDLDRHVGHVVAIRGPVGNSKIPHIIGVAVKGGRNLPDACAVGMLGKFVTTEADWEKQRKLKTQKTIAGSFGPGTRYRLYSSLVGAGAEAQAWGTGYTKDLNKVKNSTEELQKNN